MIDSKFAQNNENKEEKLNFTFPVYHLIEIDKIRDNMHHKALEIFENQILELNGFILLKHEEEKFFYINLISVTQDDLNFLRKMKDILKDIDTKHTEKCNTERHQKIKFKIAKIELSLQKLDTLINLIPSKKEFNQETKYFNNMKDSKRNLSKTYLEKIYQNLSFYKDINEIETIKNLFVLLEKENLQNGGKKNYQNLKKLYKMIEEFNPKSVSKDKSRQVMEKMQTIILHINANISKYKYIAPFAFWTFNASIYSNFLQSEFNSRNQFQNYTKEREILQKKKEQLEENLKEVTNKKINEGDDYSEIRKHEEFLFKNLESFVTSLDELEKTYFLKLQNTMNTENKLLEQLYLESANKIQLENPKSSFQNIKLETKEEKRRNCNYYLLCFFK